MWIIKSLKFFLLRLSSPAFTELPQLKSPKNLSFPPQGGGHGTFPLSSIFDILAFPQTQYFQHNEEFALGLFFGFSFWFFLLCEWRCFFKSKFFKLNKSWCLFIQWGQHCLPFTSYQTSSSSPLIKSMLFFEKEEGMILWRSSERLLLVSLLSLS